MPIGAAAYRQECTYWPSTGQDGYGAPTFGTPSLRSCRWENRNEEFVNDEGEKALSRSQVWTYNPMDTGGWVALGNHTATPNPLGLSNAWRIQRSDEIPDLRGLNRENRHFL